MPCPLGCSVLTNVFFNDKVGKILLLYYIFFKCKSHLSIIMFYVLTVFKNKNKKMKNEK
jgi:hypothetical protein